MSKPNCRCELCTSALECEAERIKDASDALAVALIAHNDGLEESEEAIESLQESLAKKDKVIKLMAECMLGEEKPDKKKVQDCIDYYTIVAEEGKDATAG